ncbi:hypothetical protein J6X04_01030 [Candidatus Saccharibacteria bacterium]|nr:hypothetical protein [Candidatus Saccharibacteria bacterium]
MDTNSLEQPTTNNIKEQTPTAPKAHGRIRPAAAGAIGAVAGLVIGAAGIYGLTKLTGQTQPCPDCQCPKCSQGSNDISYDFLKLESASDNIIYSPLSIRNGLALLNVGTNGTTKTEIEKVLGDSEITKYQNIPDTLSLANAVFIRDTFKDKVLSTYIESAQNNLGSEILYDPFTSSANMDNWVKQKTFNLIDSIGIQPTEDLEMVLANALAIQMDWEYPFDTDDTRGRTFYKKDGSEMEATTMYKKTKAEDIKYYTNDTITAISMPLDSTVEDVKLDFIAIMPSGNLDEYIGTVDQSQVATVVDNFISASDSKDGVVINMPKFKFDYQLKFKEDLQALGIQTAFNKKTADFSNMASYPLYVGQAIHKANIDFSEKGIKAAAVTAFAMIDATAMPEEEPQPIIIDIDHPFLFLIRDAANDTIWFTGAVYQPNLWADDAEAYKPNY